VSAKKNHTEFTEWSDQLNPFNSMKVLVWREQLEALAKGKILPPVTVDTDPTNKCNFNCPHCNAQKYRSEEEHTLSEKQLNNLVCIYSDFGVKSTCVSGGGEPTLNPHLATFIWDLNYHSIESGVITNGSVITEKQIDAILHCSRWCGISVDASNGDTFIKIKGIKNKDIFGKVIKNIENMCKINSKLKGRMCDIAFKYLLFPENVSEIYDAVKLAKEIGCQHFHLRPACVDNIESNNKCETLDFTKHISLFDEQISKAMELEDGNFKVFGIRHKFGKNFKRKLNFSKCRATPLLATFGADGNCHLCFDMRGKKEFVMCKHEEILKFWGSDKHKKMINSININECPRCTFGTYNEIIEKVFIKDSMCKNFP